jgi:hypothetical protein
MDVIGVTAERNGHRRFKCPHERGGGPVTTEPKIR